MDNLPPEARESVSAILGDIIIGDEKYLIVRSVTTTRTARVDIASDTVALRLPYAQPVQESSQTYLQWLLAQLKLPRLEVPSAPTKPESEPTPVSLNDYLLYCTLTQDEIGFSVFGHKDAFKNIKRKYVFEIIYGIYNIETAEIQDKLRDVQTRLRELKNQDKLFSQFLKDTVLENRAEIERKLQAALAELEEIESNISETQAQSRISPSIENLQTQVPAAEADVQRLKEELDSEQQAIDNLQRLSGQLESQIGKITRSIVAQKYLTGIEFVVCPRCGKHVIQNRATNEICYLCLQQEEPQDTRQSLIEEQSRIEAQLSEARELLEARKERIELLKKEISVKEKRFNSVAQELDFQTRNFISLNADKITTFAAKRAETKALISQLNEYLGIFHKIDEAQSWVKELEDKKTVLEQQLDSSLGDEALVSQRIDYLNQQFNDILEKFHPPAFGEEKHSSVDRRTYLPIYHGRRFDDLSSPGLATLVNIAYTLAHQQTSIDLNLNLPNILLIDGLSEHLGEEGLDPERLEAVYKYLIDISERYGNILQLIVVDNEVPSVAKKYIKLELSETDRLIPTKQ
jgi:translation initiation factor 2 beta subunit (eIF-2beta)/eIF-5